jgi:hypothetical protein
MDARKRNDWLLNPTNKQVLILVCSWLLSVTLILLAKNKPLRLDYSFWFILATFILIIVAVINNIRNRN